MTLSSSNFRDTIEMLKRYLFDNTKMSKIAKLFKTKMFFNKKEISIIPKSIMSHSLLTHQQRVKQLQKLLKIPKIIQKTEEWYNARQNIITASDFAQALGKGKFGTQKQFYKKKCEVKIEPTDTESQYNPFFKWGNMFEDVALSIYSHENKVKIHEFGLILHPKKDFFGASPDGITEQGIMVEIKCPRKRKISDEVPLQYYYQIQGQLDVCELDICDYFECEFEEIENRDDFFSYNSEFKYWGIVDDISNTSFEYSPLNASNEVLEDWLKTIKGKPVFWVLKKFQVIRVEKNEEFIEENMSALEKVWKNINVYKKDSDAFNLEVLREMIIETEPYKKLEKDGLNRDISDKSVNIANLSKYAFID